jgi:hypothetical protein
MTMSVSGLGATIWVMSSLKCALRNSHRLPAHDALIGCDLVDSPSRLVM